MASRRICLALTLLLALCGTWSPIAPALEAEGAAAGGVAGIPSSIVNLTNVERARAGLAPLNANTRLMQAAQLQAEQMAALGRMAHVLRDVRYPEPKDRLAAVGYRWRAYAENVAYGQRGPEDVTDSWMTSAGHRANMLSASFTELGTGYAVDRHGRSYFVQLFGTPL